MTLDDTAISERMGGFMEALGRQRIEYVDPSSARFDRALRLLVIIGRKQVRASVYRMLILVEREARVRRIIMEHVDQRCADAVEAGMDRAR